MRLHTSSPGWSSLLISALLFSNGSNNGAWAKKDAPSIKLSEFDFVPLEVSYFDDSDVILFGDAQKKDMYRSANAGESWEKVDGPPPGKLFEMIMHPFDKERAYYITMGDTHWSTKDRGKTWQSFKTQGQPSGWRSAMNFHANDPDRIIFNAAECDFFCTEMTLYTTDHFKTTEFLRGDTAGCYWAKSTELFTTGRDDLDKDRIICVAKGKFSDFKTDYKLVISDDFFKKSGKDIQEFEPELERGRTVPGIVNMAVRKGYLIAAASAEGTDEMALYISDDSIKWHRAIFPADHKLAEKAYTVLEGTNYSIQIDVMSSSKLMGTFLSSNSNGTYFTRNIEHTNRNKWGLVDFEKVSGIQGIVLVNVIDNFEEYEKKKDVDKKVKSKISFDDGREFSSLIAKDENLHLHSVTELSNSGRVFSSPAPGLVMGIGNVGDYLKPYADGNLYVSDNAGLTWSEALKGPHKYEFGDQGSLLVAIKDDWTDEIWYSLNHGKDWKSADLPQSLRPLQLTTTQDSTSLKFLLEAANNKDLKDKATKAFIVSLDFDDLHESKCDKDKDFEKWWARVDDKGKPMCLMGHTQSYNRRKADSDCFVKEEFKDPIPTQEDCPCSDIDFECDFNFVRSADRKECKQLGPLLIPHGACKDSKGKFQGSSGWRKIPGNTCDEKKGINKAESVERDCEDGKGHSSTPADGKVTATENTFKGSRYDRIEYLERTTVSSGTDETVVMLTNEALWISEDHGKTWREELKGEDITNIIPHPYFKDVVFFLTKTEKVFYSTERGKNIRSFKAEHPPTVDGIVMSFHPKHPDWIIFIGEVDCPGRNCHRVASFSKDRGSNWQTLQRYVGKCEFIGGTDYRYFDPADQENGPKQTEQEKEISRDRLIYCSKLTREDSDPNNPLQLVWSTDFFETFQTPFKDLVNFATMSEFVVVASKDPEHNTLKIDASVDGQKFADAKFPSNFKVDHQQAYTVLDSSTHSVFLHVTVSTESEHEYGTIVKSNSNGTSFTKSIDGVDQNRRGYVDFEKSYGIEGVAIINVVANYEDRNFKKDGKLLQTRITHNDGAEWALIPPPSKDAEGKPFACQGSGLEKCALHLHGYTERINAAHTFSSKSAIGLLFGTGSVGEYLKKDVADTFMSSDGGITWKPVKKGKYMWEFGDQGSILVIVAEHESEPTKVIHYSVDEGDSWKEFEFSSEPMHIAELSTVPSDNSRKFLLWGKKGNSLTTVRLDFTRLTDKQCKLDEDNVEAGDYYLWTPKHPLLKDDCLFGHVSQYHRKKISSNCYNGKMIPHLHDIANNCTCARQDYECDFNYQRAKDGSCVLVEGFTPPDHSLICKSDSKAIEYYEPTGYRRLPITTCEGGLEFDKIVPRPCPGREADFNDRHGASGLTIFFAIIIPFILAGGIGYWVWTNWGNKFGQIRLGEQSSFDSEAPYIKYPVLAIAGVVAVAQALPLLATSLVRSASSLLGRGSNRRFTTRDSFARGRGDYAAVDEDEGELLGDDSDDEV